MLRYDWNTNEIGEIYEQPLPDLLFTAQTVHRANFNPREIQRSTLLSLKTGGCEEDCAYCSQSRHNSAEIEIHGLLNPEDVVEKAQAAKAGGSTRFCMSMTGREVASEREFTKVLAIVRRVAELDLEVCCTLGMLSLEQARQLKEAGCAFYNHNLDTSPEFYPRIISTRTYEDRLRTLEHVAAAGISICSGGILGMGETRGDRFRLLEQLANHNPHPQSVPINMLVRISGTPLEKAASLDPFELVRTIATARIILPSSSIRLAAGRMEMSDELQALCFFAGANSVFTGVKLLTAPNPNEDHDLELLARLGMGFASEVETKTKVAKSQG